MSNEFGEALRRLRQSRGLRQVDLETAGRWYPKFISALEVGRRRPTWNTLIKLADLLEADVEWLRGLEQAKSGGPIHPLEGPAVRMARRDGWTAAEVAQLRQLASEGMKSGQIAKAVGRTTNAVTSRARKEGIRLGRTPRPSRRG